MTIRDINSTAIPLRDFIDQKFDHVEQMFEQHQREHVQHDNAHKREHEDSQKAIDAAAALQKETKKDANEWRGAMDDREKTLATKVDIHSLADAINKLEISETKRSEREALRLVNEADERVAAKDRQSAAQWRIGLLVGIAATTGSILVNFILQLLTEQ